MKRSLFFLACLLTITGTFAQHPIGIFDDHMDIGHPKLSGDATYDANTQTYTVTGAGDNIWFNRDEFQFVYKKITGDFILTADFAFMGDTAGAVGHRKPLRYKFPCITVLLMAASTGSVDNLWVVVAEIMRPDPTDEIVFNTAIG